MKRVTHMDYPDGWQEDYSYDAIGQLLSIKDTAPTKKDMKQQKNTFTYDDCGNMTYEYMRGNGTGEATTEVYYSYDVLHQVTQGKENYGNATRNYQYDSLGNLTYESNSNNVKTDYKLNNLNQITTKSDDGWKTSTAYTYDKRGNLTKEVYTKNGKASVTAAYVFDVTNKMVNGTNDIGEQSAYLYNGLNALVQNTWTVKKNAYGYHNVTNLTTLATLDEAEILVDAATGKTQTKEKLDAEVVAASPTLNKTSVVQKNFVIDYTRETMDPLFESEVNGLDYRYVYGNERLSVNIKGVENGSAKLIENGDQIRLYYHQDLRGTVDYLTSPVTKKVESWTHYNEWGEITHNAVLKCGQRELDLVKNYTGHDYDQVLGLYYAKARMYDAGDRRFISVDPVKGRIIDPLTMVQYIYCLNNPLIYIDPDGLSAKIIAGPFDSFNCIEMIDCDFPVYAVGSTIVTDAVIATLTEMEALFTIAAAAAASALPIIIAVAAAATLLYIAAQGKPLDGKTYGSAQGVISYEVVAAVSIPAGYVEADEAALTLEANTRKNWFYYPAIRASGSVWVSPLAVTREVAKTFLMKNDTYVGVMTPLSGYAKSLCESLGGATYHNAHGSSSGYWHHYHAASYPKAHCWFIL